LGKGQLQAIAEAAGVAFVAVEGAIAFLNADSDTTASSVEHAIDDVETRLPFVESHLEIQIIFRFIINSSPFYIEDSVRRRAVCRHEDPISGKVGAQIIPVREDRRAEVCIGQTGVEIIVIGSGELQVAVGADNGAGVGLAVERAGEREQDGSGVVVAMVANIGDAGHEGSARRG
jgi:hypothetical protein